MKKEERYKYRSRCENCGNPFPSDKSNRMFCGEICTKEYFDKKYSNKINNKQVLEEIR